MGSIYTAQCPCGFEQPDLMEGCGFSGLDTSYEIQSCKHCEIIYSKQYGEDKILYGKEFCKKCHRDLTRFEKIDEEEKYVCPRCGGHSLKFFQCGVWD